MKTVSLLVFSFIVGACSLLVIQKFTASTPEADRSKRPSVQLGDVAPNFTATTTVGTFEFHDWLGKDWGVLFSHPKAFTPVCSTELGVLALFKNEFKKRNAKIIALSVDTVEAQKQWVNQINSTQMAQIDFPLIADPTREIAGQYGMVDKNSKDEFTIRSVFIIDPDKRVRLRITYPATTGRNFAEILRVLDSLQLADKRQIATPANWVQGGKVVIPAGLSEKKASRLFNSVETILPYLKLGKFKD